MYNHQLRGLIVNSGMTQKEFAGKIGVSSVTLTHILRGRNKKGKHLRLIADYFNKPITAIFKGGIKHG